MRVCVTPLPVDHLCQAAVDLRLLQRTGTPVRGRDSTCGDYFVISFESKSRLNRIDDVFVKSFDHCLGPFSTISSDDDCTLDSGEEHKRWGELLLLSLVVDFGSSFPPLSDCFCHCPTVSESRMENHRSAEDQESDLSKAEKLNVNTAGFQLQSIDRNRQYT
jgi:hypothetical protein